MPSLAKTVSKSRVNLRSRSRIGKRSGVERSLVQRPGELAGLLGDPDAGRVRCTAGQVDAPAVELYEEQHVQPLQRDGLDGEEIDRDHALGLRPQKGTPRESGAVAGRPEPRLPQDLPHGRRRNGDAEAVQLADDPLIAPARVLARQAKDQRADLPADRRPTSANRINPAPGDEAPMPPQQRRWRDEEGSPARPRQQLTCRGKEDSIGRRQLRSTCLSAQYRELVSEHDELEFLEVLRAGTQRHELQHAAEHQVAERPEQEPAPRMSGTGPRLYDRPAPRGREPS